MKLKVAVFKAQLNILTGILRGQDSWGKGRSHVAPAGTAIKAGTLATLNGGCQQKNSKNSREKSHLRSPHCGCNFTDKRG
jgi:hypothetical protein